MTSSPVPAVASMICLSTPTEPGPIATWSAGTLNRLAIALMSDSAPLSGYRLTCRPASAITWATEGSGRCGDSFDDSLCASCPARVTGALPGWYGGIVSRTGRNFGVASVMGHSLARVSLPGDAPLSPPGLRQRQDSVLVAYW
jgi:hypothetical protein